MQLHTQPPQSTDTLLLGQKPILGGTFEIVHSRNYNIAFSFYYRGRARYRIKQILGLVTRLTSRTRGALSKIIVGFQSMLGGEVKAFTSEFDKTRWEAISRAKSGAIELGANVMVSMDVETSDSGLQSGRG